MLRQQGSEIENIVKCVSMHIAMHYRLQGIGFLKELIKNVVVNDIS